MGSSKFFLLPGKLSWNLQKMVVGIIDVSPFSCWVVFSGEPAVLLFGGVRKHFS